MSVTRGRVLERDLEAGFEELTPTQLRVLEGVNSGRLNKQIAFDLGIAEATVKAHMTALMRKLNVQNRTQAAIAAQALANGLRSPAR
jgi:DNA-binding NarL/FixJ family response regulator